MLIAASWFLYFFFASWSYLHSLALVVVVEGIVFADDKNVGGSRVFTVGAGLTSLLLFTFMVGAAVDMTVNLLQLEETSYMF